MIFSLLHASTLVETAEGLKPIEEIREGDLVLAYDEQTGEQAYKPVVQLFRNETTEWQYVYIEGEAEPIISTPGHKYYLPGNEIHREDGRPEEHASYAGLSERWVSACSLKKGDRVLLSDGKYGTVERTVCVKLAAPETTYNFEVADFHTYYVSDCKVLVHNSDCNPGSAKKYSTHESRNAAFRAAKRDAGIPMGQQPTKVIQSVDKLGKAIPGRTYIFKSGQNTIKIMEHAAGHVKGGIGPHFNISGYNWHYLYP